MSHASGEEESNGSRRMLEQEHEYLEDLHEGQRSEEGEEGEEGDDYEYEEEEEAQEGEQDNTASAAGIYNAVDVNDQIFEELKVGEPLAREVQTAWEAFLRTGATREAAGEALYSAVFDAAPSLQSLFKTPRAVMAMRFINGLNQIVASMHDPAQMKVVVETLGFQHLELEVTVPRVVIFRDAITDLLNMELGQAFSTKAADGMKTLLNYVGGAYIYIRVKYSERLKILASSWATANNRKLDEDGNDLAETMEAGAAMQQAQAANNQHVEEAKKKKRMFWGRRPSDSKDTDADRRNPGGNGNNGSLDETKPAMSSFKNTSVPTTYSEMFMFNAAVMGFGDREWMNEVLSSFNTIVRNVSNSGRLQEECDVLALRISKWKGMTINLGEYKAVMLASLRSLVPKDWNSQHEISWSWLWENVERMIKANLGKPTVQEKSLGKFLGGLEESTRQKIRRDVYSTFFTLAPAGQDYFKQSTTRLHFIADRIVAMTLEMFKDPNKMVEDISALGLRHVGYGIPTELFGPFVTACVTVVRSFTDDETAEEAFRWSLGLVSRILTRVINEGSTIVMKAINMNNGRQLRKAISCAPRGKRALWMLNIQVGTQSISPLLWAIETGSLEAAKAIILDLLTIRADRDRYYYGMDTMFERHPDIVRRVVQDAPALLPTLFDGLVWRSRTTEGGMRRVNYYIKHLLVDADSNFAKTIEWIVDNDDPKIVCHPVIAMVTDVVWSRVAFRAFLYGKAWLILTLIVYIFGVSIFDTDTESQTQRIITMVCRLFTYLFSMCPMIYTHLVNMCTDFKKRDFIYIYHLPIPAYLARWQDVVSLLLGVTLILMLGFEPILACISNSEGEFRGAGLFTQECESGRDLGFAYSVMSLIAMSFYFLLTIDLSVFSTRVSAFVLICSRVMSEVYLYLFAMVFLIVSFSCGISSLKHNSQDFSSISTTMLSLLEVATMTFDQSNFRALKEDPALLVTVIVYIIVSITFLLNLLIAQMNCAYSCVYNDMVGFARLNRGKIVTECMPSVSKWRWQRFVKALRLDEPCEFGEGDIGLSGAIQVMEPASQNITTVDTIRRFGGSTSPSAQWPVDDAEEEDDESNRFAQMEKMLEKAIKRMSPGKHERGKSGSSGNPSGSALSGPHNSSREEKSAKSASEAGSEA